MNSPRPPNGYAMVAAVAAIAVFAMIALMVMNAARGTITSGSAEIDKARVAAAADAGIALALSGLLAEDRANRWSIDGRTRRIRFDDTELVIRVEDERGKVPLNRLDEDLAGNLLRYLQIDGERADIARDSLLDWVDDDEEPRANGAETDYYRPQGIRPRNSPLQTIDELALIKGFDRAMVEKLRRFATVDFGGGSFDVRFAQSAAIEILQGDGGVTPASIDRQRELDGQRAAIELGEDISLVGRPLAIVVDAKRAGGGRARRRMIVELTGSALRPYVVRSYD